MSKEEFQGKNSFTGTLIKREGPCPKSVCPACKEELVTMQLVDGDTVTVAGDFDDSRFYPAMMWGNCPSCGEVLYVVELTIVPETRQGWVLFNDGCWKAETSESFLVEYGDMSWGVDHHKNVKDVLFSPGPNQSEENKDDLKKVRWLDFHFFKPFCILDNKSPQDHAQEMLQKMIPLLLKIEWEGDNWVFIHE